MADTISDKLVRLNEVKQQIKQSIINKGVAVADTDTFASYATKIGEIQSGGGGEVVDKTKFGVSIDNILGNVDAEGTLTPANAGDFVLDLTGVKAISGLRMFTNMFTFNQKIKAVYAPDLKELAAYAFENAFFLSHADTAIFGIETIQKTWYDVFEYAFQGYNRTRDVRFPELKSTYADYAMRGICAECTVNASTMFPKLEEISGTQALGDFCKDLVDNTALFPKVKKITGATSSYLATFYTYSGYKTAVFKFPEATEFTGYIFSSTFAGEIHFAAANQAAIEACDGYANKWGATNATIYFDL